MQRRAVVIPLCCIWLCLALCVAACVEPECPPGYFKIGKICKRIDAGAATVEEEVETGDEERDASLPPEITDPTDAGAVRDSSSPDLSNDADSPDQDSGLASTAQSECSPSRSCRPGYACNEGRCLSTCTEQRCDAPVTCDALPNPANGSVAAAAGSAFEQWAEYSCSNGYALSGGNTRRQCQADRTWSGMAPTCVLACQVSNDCRPGAACLENADCGSGNTCEGNVCLASSCAGGTVSNVANLGQMRFCKEINGDLLIPMDPNSLAQIELPYLTRVLGKIEFSRPTEFIAKRSVTFGALTHVGGSVVMTSDSGVETELRFPRLERVDGAVSFARIRSVTVLDLSALTTAGELGLQYLYERMDLRIGALQTVTTTIAVMWVPWIGYRPIFQRLADPAQVSVGQGRLIIQVGCSLPDNRSPDCPAQ